MLEWSNVHLLDANAAEKRQNWRFFYTKSLPWNSLANTKKNENT